MLCLPVVCQGKGVNRVRSPPFAMGTVGAVFCCLLSSVLCAEKGALGFGGVWCFFLFVGWVAGLDAFSCHLFAFCFG